MYYFGKWTCIYSAFPVYKLLEAHHNSCHSFPKTEMQRLPCNEQFGVKYLDSRTFRHAAWVAGDLNQKPSDHYTTCCTSWATATPFCLPVATYQVQKGMLVARYVILCSKHLTINVYMHLTQCWSRSQNVVLCKTFVYPGINQSQASNCVWLWNKC